jgi:hypothetical protein
MRCGDEYRYADEKKIGSPDERYGKQWYAMGTDEYQKVCGWIACKMKGQQVARDVEAYPHG